MIEVLMREYWSRGDAFLLPLTKLRKDDTYNPHLHMFWNDYSVENYNLILSYDTDKKFLSYCRNEVFPVLDQSGFLIENYDVDNKCIFILDMSEWAMDIEMLLKRKYSKLSRIAKRHIEEFHKEEGNVMPLEIYSTLYPLSKQAILNSQNALEYVSKNYSIDMEDLNGEVGSRYNKEKETLSI